MFKEVGLGSLYKAIGDHFRTLARLDAATFGHAEALPKPGRAGHPPTHYAKWVKWIIDARNEHGRGYVKKLLAEHSGETRSNVLRKLEPAEQLGLYVPRNEDGKLGAGDMTHKCRQLLTNGERP